MALRPGTNCDIRGNLGRDPEIKETKDGKKVATLSVAVTYKRKGDEETVWTRITVFGPQAEWITDARKGDFIIATGLQYHIDEWVTNEGEDRKTHHFRTSFGSEVMFHPKGGGLSRQEMAGEENQDRPAFSPEKRGENSSPNDLPVDEEPPF